MVLQSHTSKSKNPTVRVGISDACCKGTSRSVPQQPHTWSVPKQSQTLSLGFNLSPFSNIPMDANGLELGLC